MTVRPLLDAGELLRRIAERVPAELRENVIVIGSIATAWAFRDISGMATVATKDIDLLLRPAVEATTTAVTLARQLLDRNWQPIYPDDRKPGTAQTPDDQLPALRLSAPDDRDAWFVELLGAPLPGQVERRKWRRFETSIGAFALPCFRYMPVAIHGAMQSDFGIRTAQPARMALAHLLEHSDPDDTPISGLPGNPPRFAKDVGRAVSLWWLANEQSVVAEDNWLREWRDTLAVHYPDLQAHTKQAAATGLASVRNHLREAHEIAVRGVLAPHGTALDAWNRAYASLADLVVQLSTLRP